MRYPRLVGSLLLASGFVWLTLPPPVSSAQQPIVAKDTFRKEAKRPSPEASTLMPQFKDGTKDINPKGPDGAKNLDLLKQVAEYLVFKVTYREYYTTSIERMVDGKKDLGLPEKDKTLDGILSDLERFVLVPDPRSKQPANQYEYIQEFGKVLDAAIVSILNDTSNTPPPVKLNAVRALTVACRSGAKVHAKTVLNLLTDSKAPLYLKYHALKAAENLLAAGDLMELQGPNPWKHSIPDTDLAALVKAVEAIVSQMTKEFEAPAAAPPPPVPAPVTPPPAVPPVKSADPKAKPADPKAAPPAPERKMEAEIKRDDPLDPDVALFIRKQAVRTLSKVRVVSVPGPNRTVAVRPGVTLARIAVGDPAFLYPAPAEVADAVIGLAGLHLDSNLNFDVLLDTIAAGITRFGGAKVAAGTPGTPDYRKMVPWKKSAAQLSAALNGLRTSPDRYSAANAHRTAIGNLVATCSTYVLTPIENEKEGGTAAPVNQTMVDDYRKQNPRKSDLLVSNDPDSKVSLPNQQATGR